MNEINQLTLQLEKQSLLLRNQVHKIFASLQELKSITELLFELAPYDAEAIKNWISGEEFELDDDHFFSSSKLNKLSKEQSLPPNAMAHHWPGDLKNHKDLELLFYSLRGLGDTLERIKSDLEGITIIYYQDIRYNACLAFPYLNMADVIPSNFNWRTYHSCNSVKPANNPEKKICWASPNIAYTWEGLITIASIPVYQNDQFVGLWSIDIPLENIHKNCVLETVVREQTNFIVDYQKNIIFHPSIQTKIDKEKGAFYQMNIEDLGGIFNSIDLNQLIANEKGEFKTLNHNGQVEFGVYRVIPDVKWILFALIPEEVMLENVRLKISQTFDHMKEKQFLKTIDLYIGGNLQKLIDNYNDMVNVVAYHQKQREEAQQKALEAQHIRSEELEKKVRLRTDELYKSKLEIQEKLQKNRQLTHILSHDLKNPIGNAQSLLAIIAESPEDHSKYLEYANLSIKNSLQIIDLVRDFIAIEEGKGQLVLNFFNLKDLLDTALKLLNSKLKEKNITMNINVDSTISARVDDVSFVNSVINNLVTNAIKFSFKGASIEILSEKEKDKVKLFVIDHGIGMPKEILRDIFKIDVATSRTGTDGEIGTGFGMPLVKKFIEEFGGTIEIKSIEQNKENSNHGTQVIISLLTKP